MRGEKEKEREEEERRRENGKEGGREYASTTLWGEIGQVGQIFLP